MRTSSAVQLANGFRMTEKEVEMLFDLPDPYTSEDLLKKFTVFVKLDDADFLDRYAALKNDMAERKAEEADASTGPGWSMKKVTEALISLQVLVLRAQLAGMIKELGDLPAVDDKAGRKKYLDRLESLSKK